MTGRGHNDLERLLGPDGPDITCEECFDQLDRYVELELRGDDAGSAIPGMRTHLQGCPACREDHDSLLAFTELKRRRER
jgi:hypothetical protein